MSTPPEFSYVGRDLEAMSFARNYYEWMLGQFTPFAGGEMLEVGAGSGNVTKELLERFKPERLWALEPSKEMFPLLHQATQGHPVVQARQCYLSEVASELEGRLDTIVYINVMEHIENDEEEFALAWRCLKPGGHLLVFVPACQAIYGTADRLFGHFRRYSRDRLSTLGFLSDFRPIKMHYFDLLGMLPWWLAFVVLEREQLSPGMVEVYDRWVVPWAGKLERRFQPPIGKNLLAVFQRPAV